MRRRAGEWWRIFDPPMDSARSPMRQSFIFAEDFLEQVEDSIPGLRKTQVDYSATVKNDRHLIELIRFFYRIPEPQPIPKAITEKLVAF